MLDLYKNIKQIRQELGLTQTDLAHLIGYADKSMIAKIEKGDVDLPQSKIVAFANALNTTPSHLMGWDESPAAAASIRSEEFSEHEKDVIRHYRNADEPIKGAVRKLLDMPEEKSQSSDLSVG